MVIRDRTSGDWSVFAVAKNNTGANAAILDSDYQSSGRRVAQYLRHQSNNAETICFSSNQGANFNANISTVLTDPQVYGAIKGEGGDFIQLYANGVSGTPQATVNNDSTATTELPIGALVTAVSPSGASFLNG